MIVPLNSWYHARKPSLEAVFQVILCFWNKILALVDKARNLLQQLCGDLLEHIGII